MQKRTPSLKIPFEELQGMIMTFRVADLQTLLEFANVARSGKKTELQEKAIKLIRNCNRSPKIDSKIRELYLNNSFNHKSERKDHRLHNNHYPDPMIANATHYGFEMPIVGSGVGVGFPTPSDLGYYQHNQQTVSVPPIQSSVSPSSTDDYRPDIDFEKLPFYEDMEDVYGPVVLHSNTNSALCSFLINFRLNSSQTGKIIGSRIAGEVGEKAYNVRVVVRFRRIFDDNTDESGDAAGVPPDESPPTVHVECNDKACTKRLGHPFNITSLVCLNSSNVNKLSVHWTTFLEKKYAMVIRLARKVSVIELVNTLKTTAYRDKHLTEQLIERRFRTNRHNEEIETCAFKLSLKCPITLVRLRLPGRGLDCDHLECFDLESYIDLNDLKTSWICPSCKKPCPYDKLILDGYIAEILYSDRFDPDSDAIEIDVDTMTWNLIPPKKAVPIENPRKRKIIPTIEISDSPDSGSHNSSNRSANKKHFKSSLSISSSSETSSSSSSSSSDSSDTFSCSSSSSSVPASPASPHSPASSGFSSTSSIEVLDVIDRSSGATSAVTTTASNATSSVHYDNESPLNLSKKRRRKPSVVQKHSSIPVLEVNSSDAGGDDDLLPFPAISSNAVGERHSPLLLPPDPINDLFMCGPGASSNYPYSFFNSTLMNNSESFINDLFCSAWTNFQQENNKPPPIYEIDDSDD